LGALTVSKNVSAACRTDREDELLFFVAGVRFHRPPRNVMTGHPVTIRAGFFQSKRCYEVFVGSRKIGFVPQKLVPTLGDTAIVHGRLCAVDRNAVPWKRYKVAMVI